MSFTPITIAGVRYRSLAAAAKAFNVHVSTIVKRRRSGTLDDMILAKPMHSGWPEPIEVRGVTYPSHVAAATALGVSVSALTKAKQRGNLHTVGLRKKRAP